jgi:hypothetical protein
LKFLQLESQLQQEEIQQKNHHFELVLVQNNSLFEFENDSYQQPTHDQISDATSEADSNEDEVFHKQVPLALSKPIIRPWEEIMNNKHITGLGYKMEVTYHILDYTKPIHFQSAGFLQESSYSPTLVQENIPKCQHCHELATWKINVLIFILMSIVESIIILHTYVPNTRNMQE